MTHFMMYLYKPDRCVDPEAGLSHARDLCIFIDHAIMLSLGTSSFEKMAF